MNRAQLIPAVRRRAPAVRRLLTAHSRPHTWCLAPTVQMHLLPDGSIRACCRNDIPIGNIQDQRLTEIWAGVRRRDMERLLAAGDTPDGCGNCAAEIEREGREGSYPEVFDHWIDRIGTARGADPWPVRMEFNLSNRCNLQCIQCSGDLSSSIRIHREGRPALPQVYDDQFFDDLRLFVPHLRHANFAGGEPFLGPENYRVWDIIAELSPRLPCTVNTNATIWNRKVEAVLERADFSFIFSLDGIHKDTYESIRIDADFDEVLVNMERFLAHARERGTDVNVNHCLMPQNYHEFADLLRWAEERRIKVNCSVVRSPRAASIAYLPREDIARIHREMLAQEDALLPGLRLNAITWRTELARIGAWARSGPPEDPEPTPVPVDISASRRPEPDEPTVLNFPLRGAAPAPGVDVLATAAQELAVHADDGVVHSFTVDAADLVSACSASAAALLGVAPDDLIGRPAADLQALFAEHLGPLGDYERVASAPDCETGAVTLERLGADALIALVAIRDHEGYASTGRILIALRRR